jgi:exosome complex exonuclease RRP6
METLDRLLFDAETSDQFIRQLMSSLVITSQSSKDLPTGTEYDFQKSFKSFSSLCDQSSEQIINLIEGIMQYVKPGFQFNMSDDFLDSSVYEHIIHMIDALLENVDLKLDNDEIKGKDAFKPLRLSVAVDKDRIMRSNIKDIPKPQLQFLHDIDNSRDRPFKPRLKSKPWAVEPLKLTEIPMVLTDSDIITAKYYYSHPYEIELRTLRYPEWQKTNPTLIDPIMPSHQQPFQYIYREEDLEGLIQELLNVREIAIDLENHSYRSFQGFTCLMQVSLWILFNIHSNDY